MTKSVFAIAFLAATAFASPTYGQNSSSQGAGNAGSPATSANDQTGNAQTSGQNSSKDAGRDTGAKGTDTTAPVNTGAGGGARAAGAGPSVPREGNGAATSGQGNDSSSGQSGRSPNSGGTSR
jgi:hypothetical protein